MTIYVSPNQATSRKNNQHYTQPHKVSRVSSTIQIKKIHNRMGLIQSTLRGMDLQECIFIYTNIGSLLKLSFMKIETWCSGRMNQTCIDNIFLENKRLLQQVLIFSVVKDVNLTNNSPIALSKYSTQIGFVRRVHLGQLRIPLRLDRIIINDICLNYIIF